MFKHLAKHKVIFVTGPHRSGTTICSRMIAHDTGHDLVVEDDFRFSQLHQLATFTQADYGSIVVQCPFLADIIHDLKYLIDLDMDHALVVFMHRYRRDIIASETRARVDFQRLGETQKKKYHTEANEHISDIRYEAWQDQQPMIPHSLDVGYESLRDHPLWIEDRSNIPFQHEIGKAVLPKVFLDVIDFTRNL